MNSIETGWLHMGSSPKTVLKHNGVFIRGMRRRVFEVTPADVASATCPPLTALFSTMPQKRRLQLEKEARQILQQHAMTLPYPAAALVIPGEIAANDAPEETDFLTICTVLSKSNERIYLRDKEPNLGRIRYGRRIALLLPCFETGRQP
jgi:hypothetical protein